MRLSIWLTIQVEVKVKYFHSICNTGISEANWHGKHCASILHNHAKAPFFAEHHELFEERPAARDSIVNSMFGDAGIGRIVPRLSDG